MNLKWYQTSPTAELLAEAEPLQAIDTQSSFEHKPTSQNYTAHEKPAPGDERQQHKPGNSTPETSDFGVIFGIIIMSVSLVFIRKMSTFREKRGNGTNTTQKKGQIWKEPKRTFKGEKYNH